MKDIGYLTASAAALAIILGFTGTIAQAQDNCSAGKTLEEGFLSIASGNPGYFPWVIDNAPETGQGFEAAIAMEVANRMGFTGDAIKWVRTGFDEAIQPGPKNFDLNMQQFSITEQREQFVDFSMPYYTAKQSVVVRKATVEAGAKPTLESIKGLIWGAMEASTAPTLIQNLVGEDTEIRMYGDVADMVEAMKADQIDAVMMDLPTALYTTAVQLEDGVILGQFDTEEGAGGQVGMLFSEGNPLRDCANTALASMVEDGTLAAIEARWLQTEVGAPVIE